MDMVKSIILINVGLGLAMSLGYASFEAYMPVMTQFAGMWLIVNAILLMLAGKDSDRIAGRVERTIREEMKDIRESLDSKSSASRRMS